jgi:hypothetical protein
MDLNNIKSRVGSMDNIHHQPRGGNVQIETQYLDFSHIQPKVPTARSARGTSVGSSDSGSMKRMGSRDGPYHRTMSPTEHPPPVPRRSELRGKHVVTDSVDRHQHVQKMEEAEKLEEDERTSGLRIAMEREMERLEMISNGH